MQKLPVTVWKRAPASMPRMRVSRIIGRSGAPWYVWMPAVSSMLIWPLVYALLRGLRRGFRVN